MAQLVEVEARGEEEEPQRARPPKVAAMRRAEHIPKAMGCFVSRRCKAGQLMDFRWIPGRTGSLGLVSLRG